MILCQSHENSMFWATKQIELCPKITFKSTINQIFVALTRVESLAKK